MIKISIIGVGNMGKAIADTLRSKNLFLINECTKVSDANESIAAADAFILAIKPEDFEKFAQYLTTDASGKLAISIMSKISMSQLEQGLKTQKVVRVMPNLAVKVGKSFSGWFAGSGIGAKEKDFMRQMLGALGNELEVNDEDKLNTITAISGCGPAYFYYLAEILGEAAMKNGFSKDEAMKMVMSTLIGSSELLLQGAAGVQDLKEMVATKGGTTEVALNYLKSKGVTETFIEAINQAKGSAGGQSSGVFF